MNAWLLEYEIFVCLQQQWESNPVTWANLVLWSCVISLCSWESWGNWDTLVYAAQPSSCQISPSHYRARGGKAGRNKNSEGKRDSVTSNIVCCRHRPNTVFPQPHLCFLKMNISADISIVTKPQIPQTHTCTCTETCLDWGHLIACDIWVLQIIHVLRVATDSSLFPKQAVLEL